MNEFKRHRQVMIALYIVVAAAGFTLLVASIVVKLYFRTPAVDLPKSSIFADQPDPQQFLLCNDLVLEQLTSLGTETNNLLIQPLSQNSANQKLSRASAWKRYSTQWQIQWNVVDARCRFSELVETKMGEAFDRMAHVHENLPAMRLKYNSLLAIFDKEHADELTAMSTALAKSRRSIEKAISLKPQNTNDIGVSKPASVGETQP